jgi:hypothetical protein
VKFDPEYMTAPQLAALLLIPVSRVRRAIAKGNISPDVVLDVGRGKTPLFRRTRIEQLNSKLTN